MSHGRKSLVSTKPLIAIVEDDDSLRPALGGLVRSLGFDSAEFASAESFLRGDASARATCLVSDFQLPGMSGIDLAKSFKGVLPVILITARTERALDAFALENNVMCVLRKPFEAEELASWIHRALDSPLRCADKERRGNPD
jgi:FixJ family two-component response regulator